MWRRQQPERVDVGGAVTPHAPVQAGDRAAGMAGGEGAEGGPALDGRAGRDGRRHRFVGRPPPVGVLDGDHPAAGQQAGEDDHARRGGQHGRSRRGGQVDPAVSRAEPVRRLLERPEHGRGRRPERPGVARAGRGGHGRRQARGRVGARGPARRVTGWRDDLRDRGVGRPARRRVRPGSRSDPGLRLRPACHPHPACHLGPGCRVARSGRKVPGRTPGGADRTGHDRPRERDEHRRHRHRRHRHRRRRRHARPPPGPPRARPRPASRPVHAVTLVRARHVWRPARRAVDDERHLWTTARRARDAPEGAGVPGRTLTSAPRHPG